MTMNNLETGTPFYCDLYHLTMAQAWFLDGKHEEPKTSEAFSAAVRLTADILSAPAWASFCSGRKSGKSKPKMWLIWPV